MEKKGVMKYWMPISLVKTIIFMITFYAKYSYSETFIHYSLRFQITSLQHLKSILPGTCSLFHLLYYGDLNLDRTLDILETFSLFSK